MAVNNNTSTIELNIRQVKKNLMRAQDSLANDMNNFVLENFENEGFTDTNLTKWRALSKSYKKKKDKDGADRKILVFSENGGRMRKSFRILRRSKLRFTFGSDIKYARLHNEGIRGMPRRRMIGDSARLRNKLNKTFNRFIFKGI